MANESVRKAVDIQANSRRTELGFVMLALSQLVSFFGIWFGYWPRAFGMTATIGQGASLFFVVCGVVGFFLAFRTLSLT